MGVDPKSLHPSILRALEDLKRRSFVSLASEPVVFAARQQHDRLQFKRHGLGLVLLFIVLVAIVVASVAATVSMGWSDPLQILTCLLTTAFGVAMFVKGYRSAGNDMTMEHVFTLWSGLGFDETHKGYFEAIAAIDRSTHYSQAESREIVSGLNDLLEQDRHLFELDKELGMVRAEQIRDERDVLTKQAEAAVDPDAKRAYGQSLELLESRLAAASVREIARQRIEGQRALVRQAVLSVRDSLLRTGGTITALPATDLSSLRQTIDSVQAQAQSVETAIEEVRALSVV